jgi:hypothetical protein
MKRDFNEQIELRPSHYSMTPKHWSNKIKCFIKLVWEDMLNGDLSNIDNNLDDFKIPLDRM